MRQCKKEIKVLFFDHAPVMGGAEFSLLDILTGMKEGPVKAVLLAPKQGKLYSLAMTNGIESVDFPFFQGILSVKRTDLEKKPLLILMGIREIMRAVLFIKMVLKRNNYSVIYTNTLKSHLLGGLAGKLAGVKVIWHFRDIPVQKISRIFALLGARFFPDRIIAVSQAAAGQFGRKTKKITVIYNGIDIDKIFQLSLQKILPTVLSGVMFDANNQMVGIVGQISRWKGQDVFLKAAEIVLKRHPRTKFLVIGEDIFGEEGFKNDLQEYVREKGLAKNVIFTGQLPNVYPLIKKLDVLVHSSIEPEPFGRVIVEAMALGTSVVATKGGAVEEIVSDGKDGLLVDPGDERSLAQAVEKLLTERSLRADYIERGSIKTKEIFGIDVMLNKISDTIIQEFEI